MSDFKPKFGLLPPIPDRPVLMLRPAVELPAPPPEVHNLEKIADPDMLGNDKYGCCVAVAIENDRRVSRAAMGLPLNKMTAAQVVFNYFAMTGGPDSGLVAQLALEWVHRNGWGADKLLCFARVNPTLTPIRQTIAEFCSGLFCVEIDASEEYPANIWNADSSAYAGGHGVATGTYDQTYTTVKTWGYLAHMTPLFVARKVGEFDVLVWDFQWNALTYARQTQLVTDYEALTGKSWTGPTPEEPMPLPLGTPTGIARVSTDPQTKLITLAGTVSSTLPPLGCDVVVYGEATVLGFDKDGSGSSKVYRIACPTEIYLLQRNATFTPITTTYTSVNIAGTVGAPNATVTWTK
jgi:hypothetical protein